MLLFFFKISISLIDTFVFKKTFSLIKYSSFKGSDCSVSVIFALWLFPPLPSFKITLTFLGIIICPEKSSFSLLLYSSIKNLGLLKITFSCVFTLSNNVSVSLNLSFSSNVFGFFDFASFFFLIKMNENMTLFFSQNL